MRKWILAIVAAAISAWACGAVAQHGTPVDDALPVIAVIVTAIAALSFPAVQLAVPLLIGGEIVIADERLRLLWFGLVIGVSFGVAVLRNPAVVAIASIVLLRWIPLRNVLVVRELLLLAIAVGILAALRWSALGAAIAIAAALFTPIVPFRTLLFPLVICGAAAVLGRRRAGTRAAPLASFAVCVMLLFFPWSGVFARALPVVLRGLPEPTPRIPIRMALAPSQSVTIDVPPNAGALIVSGANMSRVPRGTVAGYAGGTPVRVGDFADWGALRREHFYKSRNGLPSNPAGELRDYGQCAWIDGAGRIPVAPGVRALRVTATSALPPAARLQIESFELVTQ